MTDTPETIYIPIDCDISILAIKNDCEETEYTRTDLTIRRDDPALVALVEAVQWMVASPGAHRENICRVMEPALATITARTKGTL